MPIYRDARHCTRMFAAMQGIVGTEGNRGIWNSIFFSKVMQDCIISNLGCKIDRHVHNIICLPSKLELYYITVKK